jgi:tripartite-type tricarboxylate transporter receptor subunit TctC
MIRRYTQLMVAYGTFVLLAALKPNRSYDPDTDFIALSRVASGAFVPGVYPSLAVTTVAEIIKPAKAHPGQINFGSSGNGSVPHPAG